MRYFIEFLYKGTNYHGWQNQPNAISVQQVLETAMNTLLPEEISLTAAGRTDAGVHAKQMYAHFDLETGMLDNMVFRLNSLLPYDIGVKKIIEVPKKSHARFDAVERTYQYLINQNKDPFLKDLAYNFNFDLDLEKMNSACNVLLDHKDFQCFSKSNTDVKTYYCNIKVANWYLEEETLIFRITADRFLRNMVRAIVGTMINIGTYKTSIDDLYEILKSKDRSEAGYSVPAHGLYLCKILYPNTIKLNN